jgi:uncharacterized protein YxjI
MSTNPAAWHPDPQGRHELRYWDGTAWSDHVSDQGVAGTDPVGPALTRLDRLDEALVVGNAADVDKIRAQVSTGKGRRTANIDTTGVVGGGTILTEPILVVNQKAKIIELNNQYGVFDHSGNQLATVNQVGQSAAKKVLRLVSSLDQFMTHHLEITDQTGAVVMKLTRPRKVIKSSVVVSDAADREIGRIVQENMMGKIKFALMVGDERVGAIKGENWRAWNFRIEDAAGNEVARITKTFEGVAKTLFTTADNYVVQISQRQAEPLNTLIVASALSVDTALKQDARGFG